MGLSASQARVLLLTSKNDALELQAQLISNERLVLAQEQERISNEYSDGTGNEIWTCNVRDPEKENGKGTSQKYLSMLSLAQSKEGSEAPIYIKYGSDSEGNDNYYGVKASYNEDAKAGEDPWNYEFFMNGKSLGTNMDSAVSQGFPKGLLETTKYDSPMQVMARNNTLQIYMPTDSEASTADVENALDFTEHGVNTTHDIAYVQKAPESINTLSSRYFTEDDAKSEAEYNTAMAKVNAIDKRLENKLNQIETQKKAVETELESSKNIVKTNEERTFKYFS